MDNIANWQSKRTCQLRCNIQQEMRCILAFVALSLLVGLVTGQDYADYNRGGVVRQRRNNRWAPVVCSVKLFEQT
jgi:hypothetical protein